MRFQRGKVASQSGQNDLINFFPALSVLSAGAFPDCEVPRHRAARHPPRFAWPATAEFGRHAPVRAAGRSGSRRNCNRRRPGDSPRRCAGRRGRGFSPVRAILPPPVRFAFRIRQPARRALVRTRRRRCPLRLFPEPESPDFAERCGQQSRCAAFAPPASPLDILPTEAWSLQYP